MLGGLVGSLATGGVGPAVALALGGAVYGAATLREWATTKSLSPLPYSDLDVISVFESHRTGQPRHQQRVTAYQHLSDDEKAAYVLSTVLEPVTLATVQGKSADEAQVIFTHMKETLIRSFSEVRASDGTIYRLLEDPHAIVDHVFGGPRSFCDNYRQALPVSLDEVEPALLPERTVKQLTPAVEVVQNHKESAHDFLQELIDDSPAIDSDPWDEELAPVAGSSQKVVNLPQLLSGVLKSTLLLGAPRSGKGYAMAKAIDLLPDNVDLWGIDPKNDPTESRYWSKFPKNQLAQFDCTELDPVAVAERCLSLFNRFSSAPSTAQKPKLLIIDEAAPGLSSCNLTKGNLGEDDDPELANWFKTLMLQCARLASVGPSKGKFVWVLSQSSTGQDLGISNGNKGGYRIVAVGHRDTSPTWFDSINASLKIGKPSANILDTGYIQNDGTGWHLAEKFTLGE